MIISLKRERFNIFLSSKAYAKRYGYNWLLGSMESIFPFSQIRWLATYEASNIRIVAARDQVVWCYCAE
ncbi:hypothetical protein FPSE_12165 [Fusarium pseudograminearum CS3096]|uniref:Uncharacterized protein n=1 Tax=Fusarium pseudograminearum (strain CS3096) TaxID=1028729 RepID=K3V778_FUSPC|nr:hypothetical protein FPSE_12165 [Fusarium pseudograminearum CS3096]EKJ67648.1 hypothetical protein FPSE_12165 [Fusarium pseudograminearum CS3096]